MPVRCPNPCSATSADAVSAGVQRAARLTRLASLDVGLDPRLRETHGGAWQGLSNTEIRERYAGDFDAWVHGADIPADGAEGRGTVGRRAVAAITDALREVPPSGTLVAVTHGGTARSVIGSMLGLPQPTWTVLGPLSN